MKKVMAFVGIVFGVLIMLSVRGVTGMMTADVHAEASIIGMAVSGIGLLMVVFTFVLFRREVKSAPPPRQFVWDELAKAEEEWQK